MVSAMNPYMRTLLLGMGNPLLSDDAVGIRLVGDFSRRLGNMTGLEIIEECTTGGLDLLQIIEGYDRLLLVDGIKTREGVPGNWFCFTAERLRETIHLANIHDANFATALSLGRRLGMRLPPDPEIHVFAVEVLDDFTFSDKMTDSLEKAYPIYSEEIFCALRLLLQCQR
ncbi:MAG: Hydrogenase maturation protease [Acidobacteria bacterium]|nr:Hydrogenase maturation protease [Acidobacteriota bacterium]